MMAFTFSTKGFEIQMWCVFKERLKLILERAVLLSQVCALLSKSTHN